jgi:hypothetical protein
MSSAPLAGFEIRDWRPRQNGTLQAFFSLTMASGLIIRGCSFHRKNDRSWVNLPSREYTLQGLRKFEAIITFADRATEDQFQRHARDAVNQYLKKATQNEIA